MCYGKAFYEQYKRRLQYDPIGALSMLRAHKYQRRENQAIKQAHDDFISCLPSWRQKIDRLEHEVWTSQIARPVGKERAN